MKFRKRPSSRLSLVVVATLVVALGIAACGGDDDGDDGDGETVTEGQIRVFQSNDLSGVAGDNNGPASGRASELWVEKLNEEGGINGLEIVLDQVDDAFETSVCLRNYREALASGEYDVFIGPNNSGCIAGLPELTGPAGMPVISGVAAGHLQYLGDIEDYLFNASISTLLEGRAAALFAAERGWNRVGMIILNIEYNLEAADAFEEYFLEINPNGEITGKQFPEFGEANLTPFINAILATEPDAVMGSSFGSAAVALMEEWAGGGHDRDMDLFGGLLFMDTWLALEDEGQLPEGVVGGWDRGYLPRIAGENELAQEFVDRWNVEYDDFPSELALQLVSSWELIKALVEETGGVDPDAWQDRVHQGDFSFQSPYRTGPTYVHPVNRMADACADAGPLNWDEDRAIDYPPGGYVEDEMILSCLSDVVDAEESRRLTNNEAVDDEAVERFYEVAGGDE